jgi:hypothetical protein
MEIRVIAGADFDDGRYRPGTRSSGFSRDAFALARCFDPAFEKPENHRG